MCVLISALFVLSAWWRLWIEFRDGPFLGVHAGALEYLPHSGSPWTGQWAVSCLRHWAGLRFALVGVMESDEITLPLIYPFAAVALPTLLVWRFVPKFPRGHCRRCGYNLTGLTEARCPECGARFLAAGTES